MLLLFLGPFVAPRFLTGGQYSFYPQYGGPPSSLILIPIHEPFSVKKLARFLRREITLLSLSRLTENPGIDFSLFSFAIAYFQKLLDAFIFVFLAVQFMLAPDCLIDAPFSEGVFFS